MPKVAKIIEVAAAKRFDAIDRDISIFALTDNNILKQEGMNTPLQFLDYVKNHCKVAKSWSVKKDEQGA